MLFFDRFLHKCVSTDCKYSTASATTSGKSFPYYKKTIAIGSIPLIRAVDVGLPTPNKYLDLDDTS